MKITSVEIDNIRALDHLELEIGPGLTIIAGPNGAGKSSFLDAMLVWCFGFWHYSSAKLDKTRLFRVGASSAKVSVEVSQSDADRAWLQKDVRYTPWSDLKETGVFRTDVELTQKSEVYSAFIPSRNATTTMVEWRAVSYRDPAADPEAPIIDFFGPYRHMPARVYTSFDSATLRRESDEQRRLLANSSEIQSRASYLKDFLWGLDQRDFEKIKAMLAIDVAVTSTNRPNAFTAFNRSLEKVLPHLQFTKVETQLSVSRFLFKTAQGFDVELDELSSGEKEVLMLVAELERTQPRHSVVFIDELELHINSATEPRLVSFLSDHASSFDNQIVITTHSLSMVSMAQALGARVYRIDPATSRGPNQAVLISPDERLVDAFRELVGDLSVFTTANKFLFLEGSEGRSSFDAAIVDAIFAGRIDDCVLIGAGGSDSVQRALRSTQKVLNSNVPFGRFFAVVDRDRRPDADCARIEAQTPALRFWNRCMIENYLIDAPSWSAAASELGLSRSEQTIQSAFFESASDIANAEVALRLDEVIGRLFKERDFKDVKESPLEEKLARLERESIDVRRSLVALRSSTAREVQDQIRDGTYVVKMHGKNLIVRSLERLTINTPREQFLNLVARKLVSLNRVPVDMVEIVDGLFRSGRNV